MVSFNLLKLAATALLSLNNPDVDTSDTISDNLSKVASVKDDVNPCTPGESRIIIRHK